MRVEFASVLERPEKKKNHISYVDGKSRNVSEILSGNLFDRTIFHLL